MTFLLGTRATVSQPNRSLVLVRLFRPTALTALVVLTMGTPIQEAFEKRLAAPSRSSTPHVPDSATSTGSSAYSQEEEQEVLERLRHLGYLE